MNIEPGEARERGRGISVRTLALATVAVVAAAALAVLGLENARLRSGLPPTGLGTGDTLPDVALQELGRESAQVGSLRARLPRVSVLFVATAILLVSDDKIAGSWLGQLNEAMIAEIVARTIELTREQG